MVQKEDLRHRLRDGMRRRHDALDSMISELDLGRENGLAAFIRLHESAMFRLCDAPCDLTTSRALKDLTSRAQKDLEDLGCPRLRFGFTSLADVHPMAVEYVFGGSRLGSVLLKERWKKGLHSCSGIGAAYMSAPPYLDVWRNFSERARLMPGEGAVAEKIMKDASTLFELYSKAATLACVQEDRQHA